MESVYTQCSFNGLFCVHWLHTAPFVACVHSNMCMLVVWCVCVCVRGREVLWGVWAHLAVCVKAYSNTV